MKAMAELVAATKERAKQDPECQWTEKVTVNVCAGGCGHACYPPADKCWACLRQELSQKRPDPELERLILDLNKHEREVTVPTAGQPVFGPGANSAMQYRNASRESERGMSMPNFVPNDFAKLTKAPSNMPAGGWVQPLITSHPVADIAPTPTRKVYRYDGERRRWSAEAPIGFVRMEIGATPDHDEAPAPPIAVIDNGNRMYRRCGSHDLIPFPERWYRDSALHWELDPGVESCWEGAKVEPSAPVDPLDVEHDGVSLRDLLEVDEARRRERDIGGMISWRNTDPWTWTENQKAALSAHWSAQLRAKVAATKAADAERERLRVVVDMEDD